MKKADIQRIFVSYARRDAVELALRLQKDLTAKGFEVWLDTQRIAGGASWTVEIENAIDRAQVVLALLTQGSYESDICRAEQLRSLRKGKRVVPVLAGTDADVPLHLESKNYRDFSEAKPYATQFRLLLQDIGAGKGITLQEAFRSTLVTAPPLPRNYLERPESLASLRDAVVTDEPGPSVALTALEGMGGIGKTILAQALSHNEAVQNAFPDGIVWTTVGREAAYNLITRMQEVCRALGDEPAVGESELHCTNRYRTLLRDKAALVIVDDVWRSQDIEPFLAESRRSKILFTTRSTDIAATTGANPHTAELLCSEQSHALLAKWSGSAPESLPPESDGLVRECGRLPLALAMVGAMLRGKPRAYWAHVLTLLRNADLEKIRAQFPAYPHADMLRAIQVSVDALPDPARVRYLALAVLLEDMAAAPAVQQTLWNVGEGDSLETAEQFVGLSLAQRDGATGGIRLHDLQLDYVRAQYANREALALIHGAVRLSSQVVENDPRQFASQVVGRLLPHRDAPAIQQFIDEITVGAPTPWLRLLHPALHPPGTPLLRTLEGHSGPVCGVAVTADGKRAVSASWWDDTLKVWDLDTGRGLCTLEADSGFVSEVAVTADGRQVVSAASWDKTLKVWDLDTGRALRRLEGHSASVTGVAVTADGKRAISASGDKTLKVWDLETGRAERTLEGHSTSITHVAVTADGKRAISASGDKTLKVWDLATGRVLRTLEGHSNHITGVALTADGRKAVSASRDKTLKVWDLDTGDTLHTLQGHSDIVSGVVVTADGKLAISSSRDRTLKVWDLEPGRKLRTLEGHFDSVWGVAVTPDRRQAVSASRDETLKVWDLDTGRAIRMLEGHSYPVWDVAVTAYGERVVSATADGTQKVWDLATGRVLRTLEGHSYSVYGVAVTGDGKRAVSASGDNTLKVWDLETGRAERTLKGHSTDVYGVAVTADGKRVVSASADKTLRVWDLDSGRRLQTLDGHSADVYTAAVMPDGKRAVSASADKTLKVWDLETGRAVRTLEGHADIVDGVAVAPDGKRAVSASRDKTLKVWDLDTGLLIATFHCDAPALCCAVANQQRTVAGDEGGRLYILSLEESRKALPLAPA